MKVILKADKEKRSLTQNKPYFVIGIEADHYRIIDDDGEPFLYSPKLFDIVDSEEPKEWVVEYGEDKKSMRIPKK